VERAESLFDGNAGGDASGGGRRGGGRAGLDPRAHIRRLGKLGYPVDKDAWLFPSRKGGLKQTSSLVTSMKSSVMDAGLKKRITPHMMHYLG